MFAKWTEVNGIKCQGKTEARVCQILFDLGLNPVRGRAVKTPYGSYTPDFDCGDFYIEVKAINSWLQACGVVPFIENARVDKMAEINDTSHKKMLYVNEKKPVVVCVDLTSSKKAYLDMNRPKTNLTTYFGYPDELKSELKLYYDAHQSN